MNHFIFGGSGFIGTHLVDILKEQYPQSNVFNLDIVQNDHAGKSSYVYCDIRERILLDVVFSSEDVIFNLGAVHKTPGYPDREYFQTNITGAENINAFAEEHNIRKIIFVSSISPYGASEEMKDETTLPQPNTAYGVSKLVAEKIHAVWQAKGLHERQLTILRPGVVFGKGEGGNFTRLYWGIRRGRFFYPGRKDTIKASIYVKELVRFFIYCLQRQQAGVELYNCTYEPAYTIEQICQAMMKTTGIKRKLIKIPAGLLIGVASVVAIVGGRAVGIHPARVRKLMTSTNISGKKMIDSGYKLHYTFEEALRDWYADNGNECLK